MKPYTGQTYESFAAFFSRKRDSTYHVIDPKVLISPCDGLLSVYAVTGDLTIPMKESVYGYKQDICKILRITGCKSKRFLTMLISQRESLKQLPRKAIMLLSFKYRSSEDSTP